MPSPPGPDVPRSLLTGPQSPANLRLIDEYTASIPVRAEDAAGDIVLGPPGHRYRLINDWARIPADWHLEDIASVAVDAQDRVYVFNRSDHPMIVFDRDGNVIDHWGAGVFTRPHGAHVGPDGMLYLVDDGDHSLRKCTPDGKILLTIGRPGVPAPFMSGAPFCRCTDVTLASNGDIFICDGYYNARVHKYAPDGRHILSWGEPGIDPGQFNLPHNICSDRDDWIYVADRESHRIQIFDRHGRYETQWNNVHRPYALDIRNESDTVFYVGEGAPLFSANRHVPNLGPRVTLMDSGGRTIARIGELPAGSAPDRFLAPHGIAVDSHGDIYVAEVAYAVWDAAFPNQPRPAALRTLRKLVRVPD